MLFRSAAEPWTDALFPDMPCMRCEIRDVKVADVVVCEVERERPSSRARSEAAAAEQGAMLGEGRERSCLLSQRCCGRAVCLQVLKDLSQRTRRIKFLMSLRSRCDFGGLGVRVSLSQESEEGSF